MKRNIRFALLIICILILPFAVARVSGTPEYDMPAEEVIKGAWRHFDFYYVFQDSTMAAMELSEDRAGYRTFRYVVERMGWYDFIRFGESVDDSRENDLLLVDDVTDSTAVFALATPFVRVDSSNGLLGTWAHYKQYGEITVSFTPQTFTYAESSLDLTTGDILPGEQRQGTLTAARGNLSGRFYVTFSDGSRITIMPVLFDGVLYLFDLSPRKSLFVRVDEAPSFRDIQKAEEEK